MSQVISKVGFIEDAWKETPTPSLDDYTDGTGVHLSPDDDLSSVAAHFGVLDLIVLSFASSADGRGFSQAGELRALGFGGHIRAKGHILVDQFRAALRSGIDDLEITDDQALRNPENQWRAVPLPSDYRAQIYDVSETL